MHKIKPETRTEHKITDIHETKTRDMHLKKRQTCHAEEIFFTSLLSFHIVRRVQTVRSKDDEARTVTTDQCRRIVSVLSANDAASNLRKSGCSKQFAEKREYLCNLIPDHFITTRRMRRTEAASGRSGAIET